MLDVSSFINKKNESHVNYSLVCIVMDFRLIAYATSTLRHSLYPQPLIITSSLAPGVLRELLLVHLFAIINTLLIIRLVLSAITTRFHYKCPVDCSLFHGLQNCHIPRRLL